MIALTLVFTLFAVWRLSRRKADRIVESREDFLAYPQTSPEIYAWLPYHKDTEHELEKTRVAATADGYGYGHGSRAAQPRLRLLLRAANARARPPIPRVPASRSLRRRFPAGGIPAPWLRAASAGAMPMASAALPVPQGSKGTT